MFIYLSHFTCPSRNTFATSLVVRPWSRLNLDSLKRLPYDTYRTELVLKYFKLPEIHQNTTNGFLLEWTWPSEESDR